MDLPLYSTPNVYGLPNISIRPRVLILRANRHRAARATEALRRAGTIPSVAKNRSEAISHLRLGTTDILLTDAETSEGPIWAFLEEIRTRLHSVPAILVFSRGHHTTSTNELSNIGITGQVAEPFDVAALRELILRSTTSETGENISGFNPLPQAP